MNREELKDKIDTLVFDCAGGLEQVYPTINKIMLLIDTYLERREKKVEVADISQFMDDWVEVTLQPYRVNLEHLQRNGWSMKSIVDEFRLFLEREYKNAPPDEDKAIKHFFNYMKKRKPEQSDSKSSKVQDYLNK